MESSLLQKRLQRFKFCVRRFQAGVELRLIVRVQSRQVHGANRVGERGQFPRIARRQRGNQQRGREKLQAQVLWIGAVLREVDLQRRALKVLAVHRVQQLDGHRHLLAGLRLIKENHRLQIVAHGHASPIEVENLRHRPVRRGVELEPDARAGQVVAAQRGWNLVGLAKPHRLLGSLRAFGDGLPVALVQIHGLAVSQVAGVQLPGPVGQFVQACKPVDDRVGVGRQCGGDFGGLGCALRRGPARKQRDACNDGQAGKTNETQLQSGIHRGEILLVMVRPESSFRNGRLHWRKARLDKNLRLALNPAEFALHPPPRRRNRGPNSCIQYLTSVGNAGFTFASYDPGRSRKNSFGERKTPISQSGTTSPLPGGILIALAAFPCGARDRFAAFFEVSQLGVCFSSRPPTAHQRNCLEEPGLTERDS